MLLTFAAPRPTALLAFPQRPTGKALSGRSTYHGHDNVPGVAGSLAGLLFRPLKRKKDNAATVIMDASLRILMLQSYQRHSLSPNIP